MHVWGIYLLSSLSTYIIYARYVCIDLRLHYVFPRDCSFPHKSGAAQALSPTQYGDGYLASDDEMEAHAKADGFIS